MVNLIRTKGKKGIIGRKVNPTEKDFSYVEWSLFNALGEQHFFCCECGGGMLDPNDYESLSDIHICPFCKNARDGSFGFSYWNTALRTDMVLDVCLNMEVPTLGTMIVFLSEVAKKHSIKLKFHVIKDGEVVPIP